VAEAWTRIGEIYFDGDDIASLDKAIAAYQKATRLTPSDAEPHYNLGLLLAILGRADEAIVAFDAAISRNSGFREAYFNRGLLRLRRAQEREAREDFGRFVDLGGQLPEPLRPLLTRPTSNPAP
jgi:tetratricopeptide (TPR) repeat protein